MYVEKATLRAFTRKKETKGDPFLILGKLLCFLY